jgi:hypothetical protein
MYGVGIQLGAASTLRQDLLGIDLNSIRFGGTNLDGSTVDINYQLLTSNFPNNYNFSSASTFVVPGSILPVPEPGTTLLSVTGGMLLLVLSNRRHRSEGRRPTRFAPPNQCRGRDIQPAGEPKFFNAPSEAAYSSDIAPTKLLKLGSKPRELPQLAR